MLKFYLLLVPDSNKVL